MLVLWLVQVRIRDATHVDVGWAYGIGLLAILYAVLGGGTTSHRVLIAVLVCLWSFLAGTCTCSCAGSSAATARIAATPRCAPATEPREPQLPRLLPGAGRLRRGLLDPALLASFNGSPEIEPLEWVGTAVWAVGVTGEWIGDRQLALEDEAPRRDGARRPLALPRHPNYFFEWVTWVGLALVAAAAPWGWLAFDAGVPARPHPVRDRDPAERAAGAPLARRRLPPLPARDERCSPWPPKR